MQGWQLTFEAAIAATDNAVVIEQKSHIREGPGKGLITHMLLTDLLHGVLQVQAEIVERAFQMSKFG